VCTYVRYTSVCVHVKLQLLMACVSLSHTHAVMTICANSIWANVLYVFVFVYMCVCVYLSVYIC